MIKRHSVSILGWIQNEKIKWLQSNNPEVPSLIYKMSLGTEKERKLKHVHKLWDEVMTINPINDVFTEKLIDVNRYDVDHFIPWSFVMNDELWNLMPMDSSLNSSKSNKLPKWVFFDNFANNQFVMFETANKYEQIHKLFNECYKDNLHSIWAIKELYNPYNSRSEFYTILQKNMQPVYDSAKRQGYILWEK